VRHDPLTDDHVPIELLTDRALLAYLREGARAPNGSPPASQARACSGWPGR
jgi:hypothetical protein